MRAWAIESDQRNAKKEGFMPSPASLRNPGPEVTIIHGKVLAIGVGFAPPDVEIDGIAGAIWIEGQDEPLSISSQAFTSSMLVVAADARRAGNPIYAMVQSNLILAVSTGDTQFPDTLRGMLNGLD
jgi:hypothetical protein